MARTKEYDKEAVIDAATHVFWEKGYSNTSVSDLVEATRLNKHSMYAEFENKEGLFEDCLKNYAVQRARETSAKLMLEPLGLGNLRTFFNERAECWAKGEPKGCLVINSAVECNVLSEKINENVNGYRENMLSVFLRNLLAAKANGEISPMADPQVLAEFMHTFFEGMVLRAKTGLAKSDVKKSVETLFETVAR